MTSRFNYLLKYIIIGDTVVGKSELLLRYLHDQLKPENQLTIGVEFGAKNVEIRNKIYRLQIWDTAGPETFRSITKAYYKNSACALVVYDISKRYSFNNINNWIEDCKKLSPKTILMVLVGNRSHLEDRREVSYEEGQALADKYGMMFYEASEKTGKNVDSIFLNSTDEIARRIDQGYYNLEDDCCGIKIGGNEVEKVNHSSEGNKGFSFFGFFKRKKDNLNKKDEDDKVKSKEKKNVISNDSEDYKVKLKEKKNVISKDNEINRLKRELNNANRIIEEQKIKIIELENQLKNDNIISLKNEIKLKNKKIEELTIKLHNVNINNHKSERKDNKCINFTSIDQKINYSLPCLSTDIFAKIEEELYKKYPEFRETNNYFTSNGKEILRFKTISENNISKEYPVILCVPENKLKK